MLQHQINHFLLSYYNKHQLVTNCHKKVVAAYCFHFCTLITDTRIDSKRGKLVAVYIGVATTGKHRGYYKADMLLAA